jgi:hypothetical protein
MGSTVAAAFRYVVHGAAPHFRRPATRFRCPAALFLLVLALPRSAAAHESSPQMPGIGEAVAAAIRSLYFYSQVQAGFMASAGMFDELRPAGVGAQAAFNVVGWGSIYTLRYERDVVGPRGDTRRGLLGSWAFEFRPLGFAQSRAHQIVDPHLGGGFELGGAGGEFRAAGLLTAGTDIGLWGDEQNHPALTLRYQWRPFQHPSDYADHLFHVGTVWRAVF